MLLTLPARLERWSAQFRAAENCYGVGAGLMAAIVDRESLGGDALLPQNPGGTGDGGHGRGLSQVDDRFHHSFVVSMFDDGMPIWMDPTFNILYGARLLSRNFRATKSWPVAIAAYNCGLTRATRVAKALSDSSEQALIAALDRATTGGDYCSDVLRRRAGFEGTP